jgi:hypothetical protein
VLKDGCNYFGEKQVNVQGINGYGVLDMVMGMDMVF